MDEPFHPRILVVDGQDATRPALMRALSEAGFEPLEAVTATAAFRLAEKEGPDLIVVDLELPDGGGFELCRKIKNHRRLADTPVVLVTPPPGGQRPKRRLRVGS